MGTNEEASFDKRLSAAAEFFRALPEPVRVISHLDADGLCACAIATRALETLGKKFEVCILPQVGRLAIASLAAEHYEGFLFLDAGSSNLDILAETLKEKQVLIVDHHHVVDKNGFAEGDAHTDNFFLLNPLLDGLDGGRDACSASLIFLLAQAIDKEIDKEAAESVAGLAVVGFLADAQEKRGVFSLNKRALAAAVDCGAVEILRGLRVHGLGKPLAKLLASSYDLRLPGVTRNLPGAQKLLRELHIPERNDRGRPRRFLDLSDEEMDLLEEKVLELKRLKDASPEAQESVFIDHYLLPNENGSLRDARSFATILNACGRLDHAELGLALARGDEEARRASRHIHREYREALVSAHRWFDEAVRLSLDELGSLDVLGDVFGEDTDVVESDPDSGEGFVLINARSRLLPSLVGTLCSVLVRGGEVPEGTLVVALARVGDGSTKVSGRIAGHPPRVDIRALFESLVGRFDGESGGHANAAGAILPSEQEDAFLQALVGELAGEFAGELDGGLAGR